MILITRPCDDGYPFAKSLDALGIESLVCPLMTIIPLPLSSLENQAPQGVILTSLHAVKAYEDLRLNPEHLFVVGERISKAIRPGSSVWISPRSAKGLVPFLQEKLETKGRGVVYLCGMHTHYCFSAADLNHAPYEKIPCYEARAHTILPQNVQDVFKAGQITAVTFFSSRTLTIFANLAFGYQRHFNKMMAYCLSERIACEAKTLGFSKIFTAPEPKNSAMIQLIRNTYDHSRHTSD